MDKAELGFESRLIPILREGVDIVKMVFFKELKGLVARKYPGLETKEVIMFAGAVINELFGAPSATGLHNEFRKEHVAEIEALLQAIPGELSNLCIAVTDALRMSVLCDFQEAGDDRSALLDRAGDLGILHRDRDMPMPNSFLELVRKLGRAHGLITPPAGTEVVS